jgi:hypothetical protein
MTANQILTNTIRHSQREASNDPVAKAMERLVHQAGPPMRPHQHFQAGQTPTTISLVANKQKVAGMTLKLTEAYTVRQGDIMVPQVVTAIERIWRRSEQTKASKPCYGEMVTGRI